LKHVHENANKGVAPSARGIEIACRFFWQSGLPAIESEFPSYVDRLAAGLVAAGSECAGNDDEISRDRDWGPRFHAYLTEPDFAKIGADLQAVLDGLPASFEGACCYPSDQHACRVFSIDGFFVEKTSNGRGPGFAAAPESPLDWLKIPESRLFDITHGQVFYDPLGEFSERRHGFATYYPDDAWRNRLAAASYECGHFGQRLLPRALLRDDYYTAEIAWWRFVEAAMRLGFLLNRRYAPCQTWLYREFCKLPALSVEVTNLLWDGQCDTTRRPTLVGRIASIYDAKIAESGFARLPDGRSSDSFILRAEEISASIADPEVARLAQWVDVVLG
jgi:hypothetical protein